MIIDSHQHFWKYNPIRDSWIDGSMEILKKDFLPYDLAPILKDNYVDGCIAVQADQSEEETKFLLKCAKENPFIKGVVGWVDLQADNVQERLAYFSKDILFKGVRHIIQAESDEYFMLRPSFQNGISKLEKFDLTYDVLIHQNQLPGLVELVKRFPNQRFVLDHMAKPSVSEELNAAWVHNIQNLAKHKNVYCKLSGIITEAKNYAWEREKIIPFIDIVVNAFGTNRLMYGSDWPVCLLAAQYGKVMDVFTDYFIGYKKGQLNKVMGNNAAKFYRIKQ
ncbi:amidohydrolase family protein [Maribacter sp.]|uniref:amidohydrolase family protein n=1 Tax=Maribacter sp. TaxID=1897614 RepID=UPI0025C43D2D|nr:amidohydrolase family protein [Maribacter sp.]